MATIAERNWQRYTDADLMTEIAVTEQNIAELARRIGQPGGSHFLTNDIRREIAELNVGTAPFRHELRRRQEAAVRA